MAQKPAIDSVPLFRLFFQPLFLELARFSTKQTLGFQPGSTRAIALLGSTLRCRASTMSLFEPPLAEIGQVPPRAPAPSQRLPRSLRQERGRAWVLQWRARNMSGDSDSDGEAEDRKSMHFFIRKVPREEPRSPSGFPSIFGPDHQSSSDTESDTQSSLGDEHGIRSPRHKTGVVFCLGNGVRQGLLSTVRRAIGW